MPEGGEGYTPKRTHTPLPVRVGEAVDRVAERALSALGRDKQLGSTVTDLIKTTNTGPDEVKEGVLPGGARISIYGKRAVKGAGVNDDYTVESVAIIEKDPATPIDKTQIPDASTRRTITSVRLRDPATDTPSKLPGASKLSVTKEVDFLDQNDIPIHGVHATGLNIKERHALVRRLNDIDPASIRSIPPSPATPPPPMK